MRDLSAFRTFAFRRQLKFSCVEGIQRLQSYELQQRAVDAGFEQLRPGDRHRVPTHHAIGSKARFLMMALTAVNREADFAFGG